MKEIFQDSVKTVYENSSTHAEMASNVAHAVVGQCEQMENEHAAEGLRIWEHYKLNPDDSTDKVHHRSVSVPGQRDPRIEPKKYSTGGNLTGPLAGHYGQTQSRDIADKVRSFCRMTVGAYISGNIHLSEGDARAISTGDAGTQTFGWKRFQYHMGADQSGGPIFPRRTKEEVKQAMMKTQEDDRKRLLEFCKKVDAWQDDVKKAYGPDFDKQPPSVKMHWFNVSEVYPSCTRSLVELFDQMCVDRTVKVTGDPGCAKSFNVILLLLYFHSHGHSDQLSGLFCNQKTMCSRPTSTHRRQCGSIRG